MKQLAAEWVAKAENDFADAHKQVSLDLGCFLCQQCVEKYLKGFLVEHDQSYPKTHDLELLLSLCLSFQPLWEAWRHSLGLLSRYAAEFRYPGEWADPQDAKRALEIARLVRTQIRLSLDLP